MQHVSLTGHFRLLFVFNVKLIHGNKVCSRLLRARSTFRVNFKAAIIYINNGYNYYLLNELCFSFSLTKPSIVFHCFGFTARYFPRSWRPKTELKRGNASVACLLVVSHGNFSVISTRCDAPNVFTTNFKCNYSYLLTLTLLTDISEVVIFGINEMRR